MAGQDEWSGRRRGHLRFDPGRVQTTDSQGRRRGVLSFQDGHPDEGPACQAPFGGARRPRTRMKDGVPVPGFDRATPVEDVFACFLRHGIRPFPNVEGWTLDNAIDRLEACLAVPPELVEFVRPDPRIGVNNPALFFKADDPRDRGDDYDRTVDKYNYPPNVMFDLARLGVGTLRHIQEPDLAWLHLIGDDVPIAAPDDMRDMLPRLNWMAFGRFTYTVITCLYTGQRIIPLLFGYGGGSNVPREDVMPARPTFQKDPYIPVRAGWDEWYWGFTTHSSAAVTYQQYALNLFREDPGPGSYAQQCCYRKCLGLLTFADLIGEYLELLDRALRACSDGAVMLTDIVPAVECGNEMDTFYELTDLQNLHAAAQEFGRYHALLQGPIMARGLGLRARLGETFFYSPNTNTGGWYDTLYWLRETITQGVVEELDRWVSTVLAPEADPLWESLAEEAGWSWWTSAGVSGPGDLVHEVGFHWFTWVDSLGPQSFYRPETAFAEEAAEFVERVARHDAVKEALGHDLDWSCCVGFQGSEPSDPITTGTIMERDQFFLGNTLPHEAGMLARRMLAPHALQHPPTFVTWYSSMGGLTAGDRVWGLYASCGLRNVLFKEFPETLEQLGPLPPDDPSFACGTHAWPRPAWFTLRRLAWLLARTQRVECRYSDPTSGAVLIRLLATGSFHDPLEPAAVAVWPYRASAYRYAYIAWVVGSTAVNAGVTSLVITLETPSVVWSPQDRFWKMLPLVPTVDCGGLSSTPPTDGLGFAGAISADWDATPQGSTVTEHWGGGVDTLVIEVRPSDPAGNPAPICVLCDHDQVGIELRRICSTTGEIPGDIRENAGTPAGAVTARTRVQDGAEKT
ncbi:MAG: hypothetical protein ABIO70_34630 [Pseudomonadota bacterium]